MNGKIIDGRYEVIEEIGRGGMSIVYLAKCLVLNRYVAIKILRPELRDDAEFIKRFKIEAQSAGSLSHPNIVSVYDVGNEDDLEYIVMEYVEGITLKQYLGAKGMLQWKETVDYAAQICSGLEHAHKKGIVHKDIKPENIMITKEGILKITDFGIAKALNQGTIATGGLTMGSVYYFSPEQARGGFVDAKTDLYSLGVLVYEMITGRLPFEGETAISIAMQHLEAEPARPSCFNSAIPKSLEAVILKAMKKEQTERYQTATQMLIDLKKVYVGSEVKYDTNKEPEEKITPVEFKSEKKPQPKRTADTNNQGAKKTPVKKKKKKADALGIVAGIFAGVAVVALLIVLINFMFGGSKNEIECPELINRTASEALELIEGTDLKIVLENGDELTESDKGIIEEQNPKAGKRINDNAKITVKLGDEPAKTVKIPDVRNMTESGAKSVLVGLKFEVKVEKREDNEIVEGNVIETRPSKDAEASEGSVVTLYVSSGKANNDDEYTLVPNLLGKTEAEARRLLEEANLALGEVQKIQSSKEKDTVVSQSEAEGNRVKKKKAISIRISNGQGTTTTTPEPTTPTEPDPSTPLRPSNPGSESN